MWASLLSENHSQWHGARSVSLLGFACSPWINSVDQLPPLEYHFLWLPLPAPQSRLSSPLPRAFEDSYLTSTFRSSSFQIPWIWQSHEIVQGLPVLYTSKARFLYGLGVHWRHSLVQPRFTTCTLCVVIPISVPSVSLPHLPNLHPLMLPWGQGWLMGDSHWPFKTTFPLLYWPWHRAFG